MFKSFQNLVGDYSVAGVLASLCSLNKSVPDILFQLSQHDITKTCKMSKLLNKLFTKNTTGEIRAQPLIIWKNMVQIFMIVFFSVCLQLSIKRDHKPSLSCLITWIKCYGTKKECVSLSVYNYPWASSLWVLIHTAIVCTQQIAMETATHSFCRDY